MKRAVNIERNISQQQALQMARAAHTRASAGGPSIPLFRSWYRQNCIEFDHIYAWDARIMKSWMGRVPPEDKARVTFWNERINATDASALGVLRRTARPEDFVVLKVDFDTPDVEQQIVDEIINRPTELAALVDEMFLEFSVPNYTHTSKSQEGFAAAAKRGIKVLTSLRRLGIRAHFWI